MSTTFDVYPRIDELPTFAMLVNFATERLHQFLDCYEVRERPQIHVRLQRKRDHAHIPFSLNDPVRWERDVYAWFMVDDIAGGTDAYFNEDAAQLRELWVPGQYDAPQSKRLEPLIQECLKVGRRWYFRRSMGQPAIINLTYGLLAGSLAHLTGGFVYSEDSAWDWQRMPAQPDEFLSWYFRPELALEEQFREWSTRCIKGLSQQLSSNG